MRNKIRFSYGRNGTNSSRNKNEIGIHSVRGGTIAGTHEAIFAGDDETIVIRHEAQSRKIFALGAIEAARFLIGKAAGKYGMEDLLHEKQVFETYLRACRLSAPCVFANFFHKPKSKNLNAHKKKGMPSYPFFFRYYHPIILFTRGFTPAFTRGFTPAPQAVSVHVLCRESA